MAPRQYAVISAMTLRFKELRELDIPCLQELESEQREAAETARSAQALENVAVFSLGSRIIETDNAESGRNRRILEDSPVDPTSTDSM